jgi:hypothetical protein
MRPLRLAVLSLLLAGTATATVTGCAADPPAEDDGASGTAEAYTASLMPQEMNRRVATCFAQSWSNERLTVRSAPEYGRRPILGTIGKAVATLINGYGYLLMKGSDGERVLSQLERDVKQISEEQDLAPHQRAMVVACVTSRLITYTHNALSKFMGTAAAASNYEGVCTEYARIAARLMKAADLEAGLQFGTLRGGGHAWNWVSLEGKPYWMEPQATPLRATGGFFIDPTGQTDGGARYATCSETGFACTSDDHCCGGRCSATGTCVPTPCETSAVGLCTKSPAACTDIGGIAATASCGASKDGSTCCALPSAR